MSNYMNVWLIGAGNIAKEYSKVLMELKVLPIVVGRGQKSAEKFEKDTGIKVITGGVTKWLKSKPQVAHAAIVATNIDQLSKTTLELLNYKVKNILVEKPAGINVSQVKEVLTLSRKNKAKVFVAYNRLFLASVLKAKEIIKKEKKVLSFHFDFSEPSTVANVNHPKEVKEQWFLANSSHVVNLAFMLGGKPKNIEGQVFGHLPWHSKGAIFTGHGMTDSNASFSYHANWKGPGRWSLEVVTPQTKLIFKPLEELKIQKHGSFKEENLKIENGNDLKFKPGFYLQTKTFLENKSTKDLLSINDHYEFIVNCYQKILKNKI